MARNGSSKFLTKLQPAMEGEWRLLGIWDEQPQSVFTNIGRQTVSFLGKSMDSWIDVIFRKLERSNGRVRTVNQKIQDLCCNKFLGEAV